VVLVPPGADLGLGFERARQLLEHGHEVRLVGEAATLPAAWPAWVRESQGLLLTELGAYVTGERSLEVGRVFRAAITEWLDEAFDGVILGFPGGRVFYASALLRFLHPVVKAFPLLLGLVECHGTERFHCVGEALIAHEQLRDLLARTGGSLSGPPPRLRRLWRLRFVATSTAVLAGALADQVRAYMRSSRSRVRLRELRARGGTGGAPMFWAAMVPDWCRINQHVIHSIVGPALARNARLGILLFGGLEPGARSESDLRKRVGDDLWPGLGMSEEALSRCEIDQVVCPESLSECVLMLGRAAGRSLRVIKRLAVGGAVVRKGSFRCELHAHCLALAKLAAVDVVRACAAEHATLAAMQRRPFAGAKVCFAAAEEAAVATADLLLQRAGVETIDFIHGVTGDWLSRLPSQSSCRCVWVDADARLNVGASQRSIVAGAPRTVVSNAGRRRAGVRNILIISNYVHRDTRIGSRFPQRPLQSELLGVVAVLHRSFGDRFRFRWRPHPADDEAEVARALGRVEGLELSRERPLGADTAWADVVISSFSSAAFEALMADVPLFLHVTPELRDSPAVTSFEPERRFFRAAEIQAPFADCVADLDDGDPGALEPERRARVALFGTAGEPSPLADIILGGGGGPEAIGGEPVGQHLARRTASGHGLPSQRAESAADVPVAQGLVDARGDDLLHDVPV
jgi:hypothetical protein